MVRWRVRDEYAPVTRPDTGYEELNPQTIAHTIPWFSSEEDYAIFCCAEPQVDDEEPGTRIYLVYRDGFTPVPLKQYDVAERYYDFMYLDDGSMLMVGIDFVRRVRRSGNDLIFGSRHWFPPHDSGGSEWSQFIDMGSGSFYRSYAMNTDVNNSNQVWAERYQYSIASDSVSMTVGPHVHFDTQVYRHLDTYSYSVSNRYTTGCQGVDFKNGYVGLPLTMQRHTSATLTRSRPLVNIYQIQGGQLVPFSEDFLHQGVGLTGDRILGSTTRHMTRNAGGHALSGHYTYSPTGATSTYISTWRYSPFEGLVWGRTVGPAGSGETGRARSSSIAMAFGKYGYATMTHGVSSSNSIRITRYERNPVTEEKEEIETFNAALDLGVEITPNQTRQGYTACRMTPLRTMVCFMDNETIPHRRYFRVLEGWDVEPWVRIHGRDDDVRVDSQATLQKSPRIGPGGYW